MGVRTRLPSRPVTTTRLGAASTVLAPVLDGPAHPARVVGLLGSALHIVVDDPRVPLVCVCVPEAVRLPCAMVLPGPLPQHQGSASIGNGGIQLGETWIGVGRWWRPLRPRLTPRAEVVRVCHAARSLLEPLEADVGTAIPGLVHWLDGEIRDNGPIRALVGRGGGLTPAGDDLLCGALVGLRTLGDPRAHRLAAATARVVAEQTTHVSAALLVHASRGECIPQLASLVAALDGRGDVEFAVRRLIQVGHSSGVALAHGLVLGIKAGLEVLV